MAFVDGELTKPWEISASITIITWLKSGIIIDNCCVYVIVGSSSLRVTLHHSASAFSSYKRFVSSNSNCVLWRYIPSLLNVEGRKFTLRYCFVTCLTCNNCWKN